MPNWKKVLTSGSAGELASLYAPSITGSLLGTASYAIYAETASLSTSTTLTQVLALNQAGFTIPKGTVVRITGSNNASDIPRITTASYEDDGQSANTLGIMSQTTTNGSTGYVVTEGVLTGIDTTNYTSGTLIFLGPTGSITGSAPQAPLHAVRLGQVIRQQSNNGSIHVRVDNGYEINELHDVNETTTTASYGDLLVKSGSVWTNSRQLTGSYGLTGSLQATSFTGSLFGTASWASTASFITTAQTASYVNLVAGPNITINRVGTSYEISGSAGSGVSDFPYTGSAIISGSLIVTGSVNITQNISGSRMYLSGSIGTVSGSTLTVYGSGSANPVFVVQGSQGELFSVTDSLSGSLFSVNDISGLPVLEAFSDSTVVLGDFQAPSLHTTKRVTTTATSFTVYNGIPTASYDGVWFEYTAKSGSNARAGQIMSIWSGSVVNFTETTTTDFGSTSGLNLTVIVSGSNIALTGSATTSGWTIKTIVRSI